MCHSQYHLCDPLGNVTVKTPLDLSVLSPRVFLTTTLLFAAHPDSTFGPGESSGSHIFLLHPMLDGSIFYLLLPVTIPEVPLVVEPLLWARRWSPAALPLQWAGFMGVFLDWRPQPGSTSCTFPITCCVFHPRLISGSLWILFGQKSFWQFVNLVGFQFIPFIFRTCLHCWFVCQACDFPCFPAPNPSLWSIDTIVRIGNLETLKSPNTWLSKFFLFCLFLKFEDNIGIKQFPYKNISNRDMKTKSEDLY